MTQFFGNAHSDHTYPRNLASTGDPVLGIGVYGTLRRGQQREGSMVDIGLSYIDPHVLKGYKMFTSNGYHPYIIQCEDEDSSVVLELWASTTRRWGHGGETAAIFGHFNYESNVTDNILLLLDSIEGTPTYYQREVVQIPQEIGVSYPTYIYVLNPDNIAESDVCIPEGDWVSWVEGKESNANLTW